VGMINALTLRDKFVFSLLAASYVLSIALDNILIWHYAVIGYTGFFILEIFQYYKGNEISGVLGRVVEKHEAALGRSFTAIFFLFVGFGALVIFILSLLGYL